MAPKKHVHTHAQREETSLTEGQGALERISDGEQTGAEADAVRSRVRVM